MKQVKFIDKNEETNNVYGGILMDDGDVICACCGGVFEADDIEIIEEYDTWVDFTEAIIEE